MEQTSGDGPCRGTPGRGVRRLWLMRDGSAVGAVEAAQQGHLLWCEASQQRGDGRLFRRHGGVSVALVGRRLAEGVDLFRYARGAFW